MWTEWNSRSFGVLQSQNSGWLQYTFLQVDILIVIVPGENLLPQKVSPISVELEEGTLHRPFKAAL